MPVFKIQKFILLGLLVATRLFVPPVYSQITQVGNGSFTNTFPGVDAANRNSFPSGSPQLSKSALGKPVPTNDWWSQLIKNDHAGNLFNYPMALKSKNEGLVVSYIPWGVYDDQEPIIVGVSGLNAPKATVADYSDWTVTIDWENGSHNLQVTTGIAMPFLYFTKNSGDIAKVEVNLGTVSISGEMLTVTNARNDADFVFYAPVGSEWIKNGTTYTSTLNGKDYWSLAMIPLAASNTSIVAEEYKKYAYVFPTNTTTSWSYDQNTSILRTQFDVETEIMEGLETNVLMGLLPHQWANLAQDSPQPDKHSYESVRGEIRTMDGNSFVVENTFRGILPTLPYLNNYSESFNIAEMNNKVEQLENDGLNSWTDSYNEGQMMNRLIQTARIADQIGNIEARDKMVATVKERLEDWLKAESGEVAFLFYYNSDWSTLIGYPAGHGQDNNINDHHFHWGYFIHAAAFMEQFEPGWANQWGDMVNLLVKDAASPDRTDLQFPFLRNFSPYAGHCWANGFATFPQGNDQESTSESMQFNSSLIHWGSITGNDEIRDLGIYLYTTEQTAIEEYWFDIHERNFSPSQQYSLVSRVWGNSYDNGTFWTSDIAASYGIELYPIHGGSLYLAHDKSYVEKLWNEIEANTGILSNQANDNLWHDIMWEYLAFIDPGKAIDLYDSYPDRNLKFGVSDAQTYYWLHSLNAMGEVDANITSNHPLAAVFTKNGERTYVAHNYSTSPLTVSFSDGFILEVAPKTMATNRDLSISGTLSSSFPRAYINGSVDLTLSIDEGTITKAEFYDAGKLVGSSTDSPYTLRAGNLSAGVHDFYAKIYIGEDFGVSNIVSVVVGNQTAYGGTVWEIPGSLEAGKYDEFEGGFGQGITYSDVTLSNEGDFRPNEAADAALVINEGATIGWVNGGEWLEYSIEVLNPGVYSLSFRYASGNSSGGGPFFVELDNQVVSDEIQVNTTGGWNKWLSKTVSGIPLSGGEHVLRIRFTGGEINLGRLTFSFEDILPYSQPVAKAGNNIVVVLPASSAQLDGSQSSDPENGPLTFHWEQLYGPSQITFSDKSGVNPQISSLEEGIYLLELEVSNGSHSDKDEMYVIVSENANVSPVVSISSPENNASFIEGREILISAVATDLDGEITSVEFFANGSSIGTSNVKPYSVSWTDNPGEYELTATATDDGGNSSSSAIVLVQLTEAPPCDGMATNGEFGYVFSDDAKNPTLTFIPSVAGVGNPTCILYYGTSPTGPYPGYNVTPDVPFQITADEGSTVYFYYTYSYPGEGEHNNAGSILSYVVGSCKEEVVLSTSDKFTSSVDFYPNPVESTLTIKLGSEQPISHIRVTGIDGRPHQVSFSRRKSELLLDFSRLAAGLYTLSIEVNGIPRYFRVVKM